MHDYKEASAKLLIKTHSEQTSPISLGCLHE